MCAAFLADSLCSSMLDGGCNIAVVTMPTMTYRT